MTKYRSLDRSANIAIFFASLMMTVTLLGTVAEVFDHSAPRGRAADQIEEIVVQG